MYLEFVLVKQPAIDTSYFCIIPYTEEYTPMQLLYKAMYSKTEENAKEGITLKFKLGRFWGKYFMQAGPPSEEVFNEITIYKHNICIGIMYSSESPYDFSINKGVKFYISCYNGFSPSEACKAYINNKGIKQVSDNRCLIMDENNKEINALIGFRC